MIDKRNYCGLLDRTGRRQVERHNKGTEFRVKGLAYVWALANAFYCPRDRTARAHETRIR